SGGRMGRPLFIVTPACAARRQSRCYGKLVLRTFTISKAASTPGQTKSIRRCRNIRSARRVDVPRVVALSTRENLECGDTLPLSFRGDMSPRSKRGHVRALQRQCAVPDVLQARLKCL